MVPHKQYFADTELAMFSCASYVSHTHDVTDDVSRWQSRSNFKIAISPSIFQLERQLKFQNIGNAHGYLADIFNFQYHFGQKSLSRPQNGGHFENFGILITASIAPQIWKDRPKLCNKSVFMVMMSSMMSQGGLKVGPLYTLINEIRAFFMITNKRTKISSLKFLYIGIMGLWLYLYKSLFMTSLMMSPAHKVGQILKLLYCHQYFS